MRKLLFFGIVAIMLQACSARILDFTVISSKNVNLPVKKDAPRVKGKAGSTVKEAVDRAIEGAGPGYDAIIDGVVYAKSYYAVLYAWTRYRVEGTPIKTSELQK